MWHAVTLNRRFHCEPATLNLKGQVVAFHPGEPGREKPP